MLPSLVRAQQTGHVRRIGVLMAYAESEQEPQVRVGAFREAMARLGWNDGQNLAFDIRWSTADVAAIARDAQALTASKPDLILSSNTPTTAALLKETDGIPIIFATVADPVESGFVASIARPGRERHRLHQYRRLDIRQMAGAGKGDRAGGRSRRLSSTIPQRRRSR